MLNAEGNLFLPLLNLYSGKVENIKFVSFHSSIILVLVYTFYDNVTYTVVGNLEGEKSKDATRWAGQMFTWLVGCVFGGRGVFLFEGNFFCLSSQASNLNI